MSIAQSDLIGPNYHQSLDLNSSGVNNPKSWFGKFHNNKKNDKEEEEDNDEDKLEDKDKAEDKGTEHKALRNTDKKQDLDNKDDGILDREGFAEL